MRRSRLCPFRKRPGSNRDRHPAVFSIGLMLFSVFLSALSNVLGKWLILTLPVGQFIFMRAAFALLLLIPFFWVAGITAFRDAPRKAMQIFRMTLNAAEIVIFYITASVFPLAETMTFWLAMPIYATVMSAIFLGEKVGWRRWTAVTIGFVGVLIAIQPSGTTFTWPALLGLTGGVFYAGVVLTTRSLRDTSDAVLLSRYSMKTPP